MILHISKPSSYYVDHVIGVHPYYSMQNGALNPVLSATMSSLHRIQMVNTDDDGAGREPMLIPYQILVWQKLVNYS